MKKRQGRMMGRRTARGMTLLSTMVAMAISSVLVIVVYRESSKFLVNLKADKVYAAYHGVDEALNKYVEGNWRALLANGSVDGVANVWAPTFAELRAKGYLDPFTPTALKDAGALSFTIARDPVGCNQAAAQCNIAYVIKPAKGIATEEVAVKALRRIGASGLINDANDVHLARSWNALRTMDSPVPVKNALFVSRVFPASQVSAALPLDGSRPLTGNWDVGDYVLTGIGTLKTRAFVFTKTVNEGDACTNLPGYTTLAMSNAHILQVCKGGTWVHATEEITIVVNKVVHKLTAADIKAGIAAVNSSSGSTLGGYLHTDGKVYTSPDGGSEMSVGAKVIGLTDAAKAENGAGGDSISGSTESGGDTSGSAWSSFAGAIASAWSSITGGGTGAGNGDGSGEGAGGGTIGGDSDGYTSGFSGGYGSGDSGGDSGGSSTTTSSSSSSSSSSGGGGD